MAIVYWIRKPEHVDIFTEGYVGVSSRELHQRLYEHEKSARLGHKGIIQNVIRSYGMKGLVSTVLLVAEEDYCYDIETKLRPADCIGWNMVAGGGKPPSQAGREVSDETREKISAIWKGKKRDRSSVEKSAKSRTGLKHSEDSRRKMSESRRGLKQSLETIEKRVSKIRGRARSEQSKIDAKNRILSLSPWDRPNASELTWSYAEELFEFWGDGLTPYAVSKILPLSMGKIRNVFRIFAEEDYVPNLDKLWLEKFKEVRSGS